MNNAVTKLLILVALPLSVHAIEHTATLTIETEVDKSKMYNFDLVTFRLLPESVTLMYDPNKQTFSDREFELEIETDIPVGDTDASSSSGYQLTLEENISACYADTLSADPAKLAPGYEELATVHLDGLIGNATDAAGVFTLGTPKTITDFNDKTGATKNSNHNVMLTFAPVPATGTDGDIRFCQGAFTISFRLNI